MDDLSENDAPRPADQDAFEAALRRAPRAILAERLLRLGAALATLGLFFTDAFLARPLARGARRRAYRRRRDVSALRAVSDRAGVARGLPRRGAAAARLDPRPRDR